MSSQYLVKMADILPPLETSVGSNNIWILMLVTLTITLLTVLLWKLFHSPLSRLSRQIKQGTISTRAACHQLVQLIKNGKVNANHEVLLQLDLLRFQRHHPEKEQLQKIIQRIKHHD